MFSIRGCSPSGGGLHLGGFSIQGGGVSIPGGFSIRGVLHPRGVLHLGGSPSQGGSPSGGFSIWGGGFSIWGGSPSGQCVGGTHPTGMHSCYTVFLFMHYLILGLR